MEGPTATSAATTTTSPSLRINGFLPRHPGLDEHKRHHGIEREQPDDHGFDEHHVALGAAERAELRAPRAQRSAQPLQELVRQAEHDRALGRDRHEDRKSTRLNSLHGY